MKHNTDESADEMQDETVQPAEDAEVTEISRALLKRNAAVYEELAK